MMRQSPTHRYYFAVSGVGCLRDRRFSFMFRLPSHQFLICFDFLLEVCVTHYVSPPILLTLLQLQIDRMALLFIEAYCIKTIYGNNMLV